MINKNDIQQIDDLIDKIKDDPFRPIKDGIIDLNLYEKAKFKILWILKEPNCEDKDTGGWDMRAFIANDLKNYSNWKRTWKMMILTTWGLLNNFPNWDEKLKYWEDDYVSILKNIAFINLKKLPGKSKSSDKVIRNAFKKDKEIIYKQIETYDPDIIIFAGTHKYLKNTDIEIINHSKKRVIIEAYHTGQYKITHQVYYTNIIEEVKKQLTNK